MNRVYRGVAVVAVAAGLLSVVGCGSSSTTSSGGTTTQAAATVTVADPWARTSPAETTMGAVYMTLTSNMGDKLTKASVPTTVAKTTEIHETVMGGSTGTSMASGTGMSTTSMMSSSSEMTGTTMMGSGEMSMRPIASLDLPAGQAVQLKPGGYHIMLIDLVAPLKAGTTIQVTLTFEKAPQQVVTATVRDS